VKSRKNQHAAFQTRVVPTLQPGLGLCDLVIPRHSMPGGSGTAFPNSSCRAERYTGHVMAGSGRLTGIRGQRECRRC
jgi:hypothetical protein